MPAAISIGLTSSSLTTLPAPTSNVRLKRQYRNTTTVKTSITNDTLLIMTGIEKQRWELKFEYKNTSAFNTIKNYCNIPQFFWVRIEDDATVHFDGYAYLVLDTTELLTRAPDSFPQFFSVDIIQK